MRLLPALALLLTIAALPLKSLAEEPSLADQLKSGVLLQHGVTVGLALAVHTPRPNGHTHLESLGVSAMPYVLISPRYWGMGNIQAKYCASGWAFGTSQSRKNIADEYAGEKGGIKRQSGEDMDAYRQRARQRVLDKTGWNMDAQMYGRCDVAPYFNLWAGYPSSFTADASRSGSSKGYEFESRVAFGWGILLHAYLHLLAGVSYAEFKPGDDRRYASLWSPVVAIGGNIDVFGLLLN
jgi:hypothetical protein